MTTLDRPGPSLDVLWEIPLSALSFVFFKTTKLLLRPLIMLNARLNRRRAMQWNVLCAESLRPKFVLPAIMTTGPRWNTHAIIGAAGPFVVARALELHVAPLAESAESWTIVVYTFPDQRTVAHVGSVDAPFAAPWHAVPLAPGKYTVTLRCYRWSDSLQLPDIRLDGEMVIEARTVPRDANAFYDDLASRGGGFYLWLHYYVYTLLRYRRWLPRALVEREFLPMGNPETEFRYGSVERGQSLQFKIDPALLASHDVYFTLYRRDSFPARWYQISDADHTTLPAERDGFYLVRIHKTVAAPAAGGMPIEIRTVSG